MVDKIGEVGLVKRTALPKDNKAFRLHRPLKIGDRVRTKRWKKGSCGTVEEIHPADLPRLELTGLIRYVVRMDFNDLLADLMRYEISKIPIRRK